jgi:hypothetical protein
MDWVGATAGILLSFAIPGLFLWKSTTRQYIRRGRRSFSHLKSNQNEWTDRDIVGYRVLAIMMIVLGLLCSGTSIFKLIVGLPEPIVGA